MCMNCAFNFIILDVIRSFISKFLNVDLTSLTSRDIKMISKYRKDLDTRKLSVTS